MKIIIELRKGKMDTWMQACKELLSTSSSVGWNLMKNMISNSLLVLPENKENFKEKESEMWGLNQRHSMAS